MKKTLIAAFFLAAFASASEAKVYIDLAAPSINKLPVAIQEWKDLGPPAKTPQDAEAVKSIKNLLMDTLKSDIRFSGLFNVIDKAAYLEDPLKSGMTENEINFKDWRSIGADTLIKGAFLLDKDRLTIEARFFDCFKEKQVIGKRFTGSAANPRRLVHYFTDQLYEELTGRKGIFTTKILFVSDRTGNKEVYMADYDGRNALQITRNRSINLSPQWSPDGKRLIYITYKRGWPCLYMLDLRTGNDTIVSDKPGINIAGRFSPDGNFVALTLSGEKSPELYTLDLNTREYKKLTDNYGIDVSPTWSPDGKKMAFVSDTAGNPHIFMLDLLTGNLKRLTFEGKYNSSPAWSPDGKSIAFSRSDNGKFNIWVMQPDGGGMTQLSFNGGNRSPSWSPDSRYIIFSSTSEGGGSSLFIMQADGTGLQKLDTGTGNETSPAWSPYLQ